MSDPFAAATSVADAVLREGHVLYPYRASALKNQMRWQFGILGPPALASAAGADASWCQTEAVLDAPPDATVRARVRWLEVARPDASGWQTTEARSVDLVGTTDGGQSQVLAPSIATIWQSAGQEPNSGGHITTDRPENARVTLTVDRDVGRVACRIENTSEFADGRADRMAVLEHSLVGVHVMLHTSMGRFESMVTPSPRAVDLVATCQNERLWPVLVGDDLMLACPIILYDQPAIAPESVGDWGDATEIEELLALRVLTLTDDEQLEAAATDVMAATVLEQAARARLGHLHGRIHVGDSVTLHPKRRADAHDLFLDGRSATVVGMARDVDGNDYVKVSIDDDPGRDLHEWFGRSWHFAPDEVERHP